jgi:hypothetical protein
MQLGDSFTDGWIYGLYEVNDNSCQNDNPPELTGKDLAYIYPDFRTVIIGEWNDGIMQSGTESEIVAYR